MEKMLTKQDIMEIYHISLPSVDRYMKMGLPYYKIGRKVRFKAKEVEEYMLKNKIIIGGKI